jgi:hypothetical protein
MFILSSSPFNGPRSLPIGARSRRELDDWLPEYVATFRAQRHRGPGPTAHAFQPICVTFIKILNEAGGLSPLTLHKTAADCRAIGHGEHV